MKKGSLLPLLPLFLFWGCTSGTTINPVADTPLITVADSARNSDSGNLSLDSSGGTIPFEPRMNEPIPLSPIDLVSPGWLGAGESLYSVRSHVTRLDAARSQFSIRLLEYLAASHEKIVTHESPILSPGSALREAFARLGPYHPTVGRSTRGLKIETQGERARVDLGPSIVLEYPGMGARYYLEGFRGYLEFQGSRLLTGRVEWNEGARMERVDAGVSAIDLPACSGRIDFLSEGVEFSIRSPGSLVFQVQEGERLGSLRLDNGGRPLTIQSLAGKIQLDLSGGIDLEMACTGFFFPRLAREEFSFHPSGHESLRSLDATVRIVPGSSFFELPAEPGPFFLDWILPFAGELPGRFQADLEPEHPLARLKSLTSIAARWEKLGGLRSGIARKKTGQLFLDWTRAGGKKENCTINFREGSLDTTGQLPRGDGGFFTLESRGNGFLLSGPGMTFSDGVTIDFSRAFPGTGGAGMEILSARLMDPAESPMVTLELTRETAGDWRGAMAGESSGFRGDPDQVAIESGHSIFVRSTAGVTLESYRSPF